MSTPAVASGLRCLNCGYGGAYANPSYVQSDIIAFKKAGINCLRIAYNVGASPTALEMQNLGFYVILGRNSYQSDLGGSAGIFKPSLFSTYEADVLGEAK